MAKKILSLCDRVAVTGPIDGYTIAHVIKVTTVAILMINGPGLADLWGIRRWNAEMVWQKASRRSLETKRNVCRDIRIVLCLIYTPTGYLLRV